MKRTIITSLLTASFIAASAQETTPLDNMLNQLRAIDSAPFSYANKGNFGGGSVTATTRFYIGYREMCSEETCGGERDRHIDSAVDTEATNRMNHEKYSRVFPIVRQSLDSIIALPSTVESYHFESHHQGIDTIQYSICMNSGKGLQKHPDNAHGYWYETTDGSETVSYEYHTNLLPCGKHYEKLGELVYSKTEGTTPSGDSDHFDWEQYMQTLTPILSQKGITKRTFKWAQENFPNHHSHPDYLYTYSINYNGEGSTTAGETDGTLYFIPYSQQEFALSVLKDIDRATQDYVLHHPNQLFCYTYNREFNLVNKDPYINPMFDAFGKLIPENEPYNNIHHYYLFVGSDERGYYFLVCDTRGAMCVPNEWATLESFVNGKKVYYKGMKPKGKK